MTPQIPPEPPIVDLKPAEEAAIWPPRKHRFDVAAVAVGLILALVVLSGTVARVVPVDAVPERIRPSDEREHEPVPSADSPQAQAIERLDPHGQIDTLTLMYLHAACWPEQYSPAGRSAIADMAENDVGGDSLPCPIPADELPHPGPAPGDLIRTTD